MKVCSDCRQMKPMSEFYVRKERPGTHRSDCKKCHAKRHNAWAEKNKESYSKYLKAYRKTNAEKLNKDAALHRRKAKLDAVRHYSGGSMVCKCCGEAEIDFLTIDHINGGGTKERKSTGRGGQSFAIWLRKRGYPAGYQILCYNCNCAKAFCKVCPHEVKRVALVQ